MPDSGSERIEGPLRHCPGCTLAWSHTGDGFHVIKIKAVPAAKKGTFLAALRRLGGVPAFPRDGRPVEEARR